MDVVYSTTLNSVNIAANSVITTDNIKIIKSIHSSTNSRFDARSHISDLSK